MADTTPATVEAVKKLWERAVKEYRETARLTKKEKEILETRTDPNQAFNVVKQGWEKNVS
jgi:hypothetical protein